MMEQQRKEIDNCITIDIEEYDNMREAQVQKMIVIRMILRGENVSEDDLRAIFCLGKKPEEPVKAEER